jgi:hypothetical protein
MCLLRARASVPERERGAGGRRGGTHSLHTEHLITGGRSRRDWGFGLQQRETQGRGVALRYWWIEQQHGHSM